MIQSATASRSSSLLDRPADSRRSESTGSFQQSLAAFLDVSLEAEALYGAALAARPGLLFEDHLEPMLKQKRPTP